MSSIRDHAVELAKAEITDELKNLESDDLDPNGPERKQAKEQIMLRLRRMQPGSTATLKAIRCKDGSVTLDQTKMAAELAEHWAQVFTARPVNLELLAEW